MTPFPVNKHTPAATKGAFPIQPNAAPACERPSKAEPFDAHRPSGGMLSLSVSMSWHNPAAQPAAADSLRLHGVLPIPDPRGFPGHTEAAPGRPHQDGKAAAKADKAAALSKPSLTLPGKLFRHL